jgi:hypothetical protein
MGRCASPPSSCCQVWGQGVGEQVDAHEQAPQDKARQRCVVQTERASTLCVLCTNPCQDRMQACP